MVHKLSNGNCYLNGTSLVGKVSEVDFPDLKFKMADFKSLGMLGDLELPSGFEKLEAKVKFNTFLRSEFVSAAGVGKRVNLSFRGNQENHTSDGVTNENVTITLSAIGKNIPMGSFKQNELTNLEIDFAVYSAKIVIGGVSVIEYDVFTNTFKVNGVDQNADWKLNT